MAKKTILVAGGAGFIGSHVNKMLHQSGFQTVVFDNLSKGDRWAVVRGKFIKGDLGNEQDLEQLFSQFHFDAVMHFAASIDVGESVADPANYYINNVINSIKLLEAMRRHKVGTLIFSSTAALYGYPKTKIIAEDHPIAPLNPYGETKLMIEKVLRDYGNAYGIKWACLRYFNAAGGDPEGEIRNYKKEESNLIPVILRSLINNKGAMTIFGTDYDTPDGTCVRDYIHICDLGDAHIAAMEHLFNGGKSTHYNLGNGKGFTVKEVIETVQKVTGMQVNAIEGERRAGDSPILVANSAKAVKELSWKPKYPALETIVAHAWKALVLCNKS